MISRLLKKIIDSRPLVHGYVLGLVTLTIALFIKAIFPNWTGIIAAVCWIIIVSSYVGTS